VKIVIDTNIVFSAILNSTSRIGQILIASKTNFQFYSCAFLKTELSKHQKKLLKLTKLTIEELEEIQQLITENITFIHEGLLPEDTLIAAEKLLTDIDVNDAVFVALTKNLKAKLWTGDKELIKGLKIKKFEDVITTRELLDLLEKFERI
jgi:predicted nucleic acid-binding protein